MKTLFTAAALAAMIAGGATAALAASCPKDMKTIDAALAEQPQLSAADLAEIKKLRAEGETLHKTGMHADSVEALHKAMKILGIE